MANPTVVPSACSPREPDLLGAGSAGLSLPGFFPPQASQVAEASTLPGVPLQRPLSVVRQKPSDET